MKKRFIALGVTIVLGSLGVALPEPVVLTVVEAASVLF